jgi:hypothetical protein
MVRATSFFKNFTENYNGKFFSLIKGPAEMKGYFHKILTLKSYEIFKVSLEFSFEITP